jgi:low temperature requirement protein LtrA
MSIIFRNFRQWWQPPRNIRDRTQHRQVTFLELFYDLIYVVLIAELTHALAGHVDLEHIANFTFLFIIVWWAWLNGTLYHDIHGNNDIRTRVFTFLQMFTVAAMAVFAHDALGDTSIGFALSYAAFQVILTYLWWRTGVHDPNHRPLSRPYIFAFIFTTLVFVLSIFVDPPLRFYLWIGATLFSVLLPFFPFNLARSNPDVQAQMELSRTPTASLVERFGLLTIIVLGEVVIGVVQGVAGHHDLNVGIMTIGVIGVLVAIGLWWLYFDFVSHRLPRKGSTWLPIWMYAHLPVTIGVAATGAAVINVIEHADQPLPIEVRWLLVVSIAVVLIGIALLIQTLETQEHFQRGYHKGQIAMIVASLLIVGLGFSSLQTIPLLLAIVVLMLSPIFFGLMYWIRELETSENTTD